MSHLHVFQFIIRHLCFKSEHMVMCSSLRMLYLCLGTFLNSLFQVQPPARDGILKKILYFIYACPDNFQGSLKKLSLEEHIQNDTSSSTTLAGIHWRRLVLNYFGSDTIRGKVPWISGAKGKSPVLISPDIKSPKGREFSMKALGV